MQKSASLKLGMPSESESAEGSTPPDSTVSKIPSLSSSKSVASGIWSLSLSIIMVIVTVAVLVAPLLSVIS